MSIIGVSQSYNRSDFGFVNIGQAIANLIAQIFARFAQKEAPRAPAAAAETTPLLSVVAEEAAPKRVYKPLDCEHRLVDGEVIMRQRQMFIEHPDFCRRRFILQYNHLPYYVKRIDVRPSDFSPNRPNFHGISNYRAEISKSNQS